MILNSQESQLKMTSKSKFHAEEADPEILRNLRCSKCAKYFFPPIFLCPNGHNFCTHCNETPVFDKSVFKESNMFKGSQLEPSTSSTQLLKNTPVLNNQFVNVAPAKVLIGTGTTANADAKKQIVFSSSGRSSAAEPISSSFANLQLGYHYCTTCKAVFPKEEVRRSIARERSTKILDFPCGNNSNGCIYRNKLFQIVEHEKICVYKERSCFFQNCNWKGTTQAITNHLDKHNIITLNNTEKLPQGKNICATLFDSTFFLLKTNYIPCKSLEFCVLYPDDSMGIKYKYEIFFMGYNEDILIGLSNYCDPLMNENCEVDNSNSGYISIPFEFFKNFIVDLEKIKFKINIIKLE